MEDFKKQIIDVIKYGKSIGGGLLNTVNNKFDGRIMEVEAGKLVSFSLCDYLGLSTDIRLRKAAAEACMDYGVYTAISRTYLKLGIYQQAEEMVSSIFGQPCLIVPRTTLGHLCVLPAIVEKEDVLILDHQVHATVASGAQLAAVSGCKLDVLRHSRMDLLENKIKEYTAKHNKIWYLADGVCSMFGDTLPVHEAMQLLDKYPNFHLYIDDAHGMSWTGENGKGFLLSKTKFHPRLFMLTSLGKGFGSGGGVIVCPDEEVREKIEILGVPLMFTSPVTPSTLGAIIQSAKIHLSGEIITLQAQLKERMTHVMMKSFELNLPVLGTDLTPIIFVASGKSDMTMEICRKLMDHGFFVTPGVFPAVPLNNGGIRLIITLHQSMEDIDKLLYALKLEYDAALKSRNLKVEDITKFYKHIEFFNGKIM